MNNLIKSLVAISIGAFAVTVMSVVIAAGIIYQRDQQAKKESGTISESTSSASQTDTVETVLDSAEVARHNQPSDCWMIIADNVYNLTSFLVSHPGGSSVMTLYCGNDGTAAFNSKDKKPASKHSQTATNMLPNYLIGRLNTRVAKAKLSITESPIPTPSLSGKKNQVTNALSANLVSIHNTTSDCWIIISGKVYNVSSYLVQHPGGIGAITPYCGQEATNAFATKSKNPGSPHSNYAIGLLANYLVGSIGSAISSTANTAFAPTTTPAPLAPPQSSNQALTTADVAGHNTSSNCWIIISGKIYNVTNYLTSHPGGIGVITAFCGQEATNAFTTKGGKGSNHSNTAYNLLNNYLVGTLNTSGGSGSVQNNTSNPTQPPSQNKTMPAAVSAKYPGATIISQNIEDNGSQELKINYNGSCRQIHVSPSGNISEDEQC